MRPFPHTQPVADWLTQYWNILLGRRVCATRDGWLLGPFGRPGGVGEAIIQQVAESEGLSVVRSAPAGLMSSASVFAEGGSEIHPDIAAFYTQTSEFTMDVWTKWEPIWGSFGRVVDRLFSRRIDQLRLPADSLATSRGITSEIVLLRDRDGATRHTLWLRKLVSTGTIIYSGFYSHVHSPSGEQLMKVVFPLPHGSATVLMRLSTLPGGGLRLSSCGSTDGDPGLYLLVRDRTGSVWSHYIKTFHEIIDVCLDAGGNVRADHTMKLWGRLAYSLHYRVSRRAHPSLEPTSGPRPAAAHL